jgi:hypothetical protein
MAIFMCAIWGIEFGELSLKILTFNNPSNLHVFIKYCRLFLLGLCILTAGCASKSNSQFLVYQQAFQEADSVVQSLFDRMAISEKALLRQQRKSENLANIGFELNDVKNYLSDSQPPITESFRQSFKTVNSYSMLLAALASGESANMLTKRLMNYTNIGSLVSQSAIIDASKIPQVDSVTLSNATQLLEPLIQLAYKQKTKKMFEERLLQDYSKMNDLLTALRNATPQMFDVMKTHYRQSATMVGGHRPNKEVLDEIKSLRRLVATFVLLIEQAQHALAQTKHAIDNDETHSVETLISSAQNLHVVVQHMRNGLSAF